MAIFPCDTKSLCVDPSTPFANFSAEAPDQHIFIGRSTGFSPLDPPLGSDFQALGCVTFCESTVSQQDADLCALRQNVDCLSFVWPVEHPGPDVFGNPVPIPAQRQIFPNRAQTATVQCPDGLPFAFTVPAGRYTSFSQAQSDQAALSAAQQQAAISLLCIGPLTPAIVCSGDEYAGSVTATGNFLTGANACWTIFGSLPPGINSDLELAFGCLTGGTTLNFFGTPTTPGIYSFSIEVQDGSGNFMVKPVTLLVRGATNLGTLPDGAGGTPYSFQILSFGFTNPIYSVEVGTLPAGLTLDGTSGVISGTPTTNGISAFIIGITEAGTGVVACLGNASINITGVQNCSKTPTNSLTHNDAGPFYSGLALISGDKYLAALDTFTPQLDLFNVAAGGFAAVATQTPNFSFGRIVWSPKANEWVHVGQDAGTQTQVWFTSYNKLTLAQTGQDQSTNALGSNVFQQWGIVCSPTTGIVYAACGNAGDIRTYNSMTHLVGGIFSAPHVCFGQLGLNDAGNRLFVANGGNNNLFPGQAALLSVYNATTLALITSFGLPGNGVGHGYVRGCTFNPDDGMVYVGGNDDNADGGDVIWVVNPTTGITLHTIRLLTSGLKQDGNTVQLYPITLTYDQSSHQVYMFFGQRNLGPTLTTGGVHIVCCDTFTHVAFLHPASDANFGLFLGDVVFGIVTTVAPPEATNLICFSDSFNALIREYTFP